jgi:hypothetical protein
MAVTNLLPSVQWYSGLLLYDYQRVRLIYRTLIKGQFAPSEQNIEQTLSRAREEKVTIVLFFVP